MPVLLIILALFMVLAMNAAARSARRRRERMEEAYADQARRRGEGLDDAPAAPFGRSPFGSAFHALMTGTSTRCYRYDPDSGRWVDITDREPEPRATDRRRSGR